MLRSVVKTRQRSRDHQPPISDLQSYLIGAFHHRFNRVLRNEHKRQETIELVASTVDLELIEGALDTEWAGRTRTRNHSQADNKPYGWMDEKGLAGTSIRLFMEGDFDVVRSFRGTGTEEIRI